MPPAGLLRGTLRAPVSGVGQVGVLEQAKSNIMVAYPKGTVTPSPC